jgi:hypothetical protein
LLGQESMIISQNKATYGTKQGDFLEAEKVNSNSLQDIFFGLIKDHVG